MRRAFGHFSGDVLATFTDVKPIGLSCWLSGPSGGLLRLCIFDIRYSYGRMCIFHVGPRSDVVSAWGTLQILTVESGLLAVSPSA